MSRCLKIHKRERFIEGAKVSPIETAVTRSRPLQSTLTTTVTTAVVSSWVECRKETCTIVAAHIIGTHTVTQCTMVFEERQGTKGVNSVSTPVTGLRPVLVVPEEGR
jgi:hypothetical protein